MILLLALAACKGVSAQQPSAVTTQGRDFWLMFLSNYNLDTYAYRSIVMVGEDSATVTISTPRTGWSTTLTLAAGEAQQVEANEINLGYHITSTSDIAVYASNFITATFDIATVYPTPTLRSHYMVQCYEDVGQFEPDAEIGILAVEDNTVVTLHTPSGQAQTFTLMTGESRLLSNHHEYQGSDRINGTMTGTTVEAADGKPLAVFQGNICSCVDESACDHLFEQSVPTDYWGRAFIVVPIAGRMSDDVVKVTSLANYCRVAVNDTFACLLDAGESYLIRRRDAYKISTMKPVTVSMYLSGDADTTHWGSNTLCIGDPAAVIIPPLEQSLQRTVLNVISTERSNRHYSNIVAQTCSIDSMLLDGAPVGSSFIPFDDQYSYAQLSLTPGVHILSNSIGLFQAWFYGMGPWESYAYIAGMALADYSHALLFNGEEIAFEAHLCVGDSGMAELQTGNSSSDTRWYLDDTLLGTTALQLPLHFDTVGTHTLKALLHGDCCQQWCDSLEVSLFVHPKYSFTEHVRFCEGNPYSWHDTILFVAGTYSDSLSTAAGCDSAFTLHLEAMSKPTLGIDMEADCFSHTYRLTAQHFDTLEWHNMRWIAVPDDPTLHGHEGDSVIDLSPSTRTAVTLHAEVECPADSTIELTPIVWPVAQLSIRPEHILLGRQTAFDAYDVSLNATGREWEVDGIPMSDNSNPLHYSIADIADSIVVVLTATNDYCRDTTRAVVQIFNDGLYAPNVFTPGQETNNRFTVYSAEELDGELVIFNREGLRVFQTTDLLAGWDGQGSPQGAYVWHLHYRFAHSPERWHTAVGTVTLLR